jgi:signal transduction histidine kinase
VGEHAEHPGCQWSSWLYTFERLSRIASWLSARRAAAALNILTDELWADLQGGLIALLLSLVLAFILSRWWQNRSSLFAAQLPSRRIRKPISRGGPHEVQDLAWFNRWWHVWRAVKSQREFVADVSHELKTFSRPFRDLHMHPDGTADTANARKRPYHLQRSDPMHRMALDLLDLARLEAGTATSKCLHWMWNIVTQPRREIRPQAQKAESRN